MGRLRTLTILLTIGVWGATEGAHAQSPAGPAGASTRPQPPAPPSDYVKAGIKLYNAGDMARAAQYLKAANDYRDMLAAPDQSQLDEYMTKLSAPATATANQAATMAPAPEAGPRGGTTDAKQQARWLLQSAREQGRLGHYDDADKLVAQADALNIKWGLFDDTPTKVREALDKVRPRMSAGTSPTPAAAGPHDRREAKARLKEGRDALAANQFEQAEAIALEVGSWGVSFGAFEDTPAKLASAARALRRRDVVRSAPAKAQPSQSVYDVLVQEARSFLAAGQLDQAEAKAQAAQRLNVVPSLTADRAESVLHDVAILKARAPQGDAIAAPAPAGELPSVVAEREANELLAKNQNDAAMAKFAEAERARAAEKAPVADPSVRQVDGGPQPLTLTSPDAEPAPMPAPPAVAALPAPETPGGATPPTPDAPNPLDAPAPAAPAGNRGAELLAQAKALFAQGNYPAAKQMAADAKNSKLGVEAQADELLASIALSEQGGALSVYEAALDAIRKGETARARALLTEVQASGATLDDSMQKKVQDLLDKLPKDGKAGSGKAIAADTLDDVQAIEAQRVNAEVGSKVAEARRWLETDPDKAIALLQEGLNAVKSKDLPPTVARTMTRRLEVAIELAKKDKAAFEVKMQDKNARAEIETKKLRILEADRAKKSQIKALMDEAQKAYTDGKLAEAETLAQRAQEIDPNEIAPGLLRYKANLERHYKTDLTNKREKEEGFVVAMQDVDKTAIINGKALTDGIAYAKDFAGLTQSRIALNARLADKKPAAVMAIEKKLNDPISLNMKNQTLDEAVTFLQNYTGLNIVLDSKALVDEGLSRDSKVDITVNGMKLKNVLKLMLRPLGLTYKVDEEALVITSPQATRDTTYNKTYLVADLVLGPNRNPSDNPNNPAGQGSALNPNDLNAVQTQATAQTLAGNLSSSTGGGVATGTRARPKVDMMPLVQLITTSIAPGTWRVYDGMGGEGDEASFGMGGGFGGDAGGLGGPAQPIGSITPFFLSISLIIRHTAEIHEDISDLLKQLRRLQDLQVSIEVRFINVTDDFFEQIGVDFDFNIQSDAVGRKSTFAVPNPAGVLFPGNTFGGNTGGGGIGGVGGGGIGGGGGLGGGGLGGGGLGGGGLGGGGGGLGGGGLGGGGGGLGGGGLGGGGGGGLGGGGLGGGGGGGGQQAGPPPYIVNPIRDFAIGNKAPLVVGTAGPGIANFTPNLGIPFTQSSSQNIGTFNNPGYGGATFGISFLSDLEVYLFLTAAQGDQRNNIVQAPKVTTFNGAPAFINNTSNRYYVAALTPIVGFGAVAFSPTPAPLQDGVTLNVTPVVSADRRYVRMTLTPFFQVVTGLSSFPVPAAVGGGGFGGGSASITGQIQLPETTTTILTTTVTVPDGGTVLLGGVKRLREERREFGVPVLAKTPLINRLFRNVGIGRRTESLMLMVTPRIIILEEEEERLGIPPQTQ